mgnify:CR=1 FL=1
MESGIYIIKSTLDEHKYYIGSTSNIYKRKNEHWNRLKQGTHFNSKMSNYYNKYGEGCFEYDIIELCNDDELIEREQFYIDTLRPYFNIRPYAHSNKGIKLSDETKEKMSKSHIKFFQNGGSQWNEGIPCSEETKKKIGETNKGMKNMMGKHHSEETKHKMSETRKGRHHTEETRRKISEALKKYKKTDKHRMAISLAQMGNKYNLGNKLSDETKLKISNAHKNLKK